MKRISNPPTPYLGHVIGNFTDGKTVTIVGLVLPPAQRIIINFQTGKNPTHGDDIALHLFAKLLEGTIVRNSLIEGVWGTEEHFGRYPLTVGNKFTITITNQRPKYIIKVNDNTLEFKHRLPSSRVNHLSIQGDVKLYDIWYETNPSFESFVPLYDDPPPPYTQFPQHTKAKNTDDHCMLETALPAVAVGTGIGMLGASLFGGRSGCQSRVCGIACHCPKCRCCECRRKFNPPSRPAEQQDTASSSWGPLAALGVGVAAVGVVGGLIYSLTKGSGNDSDDD